MGRVKSVNFSHLAVCSIQSASEGTAQHLKEAIRDLSEHPALGRPLKLETDGLKTYRVGSFRIFHRIRRDAMDIVFLELREDVFR